jgi:hypothetical protein
LEEESCKADESEGSIRELMRKKWVIRVDLSPFKSYHIGVFYHWAKVKVIEAREDQPDNILDIVVVLLMDVLKIVEEGSKV